MTYLYPFKKQLYFSEMADLDEIEKLGLA